MSTTSRIAATCLIALTAVACDTQTQTYEYTGPSTTALIKEVIVDLNSGSVRAAGTPDMAGGPAPQVKSTAIAQWYGEKPTVEFLAEGATLRINALCGDADLCRVDLDLEMPPGATLKVTGEKTDVAVTDLAGTTIIETEDGAIELGQLDGSFDVSTVKGSIAGTGLASAKGIAETVHGSIDLQWLARAPFLVMADAERGDITMTVPNVAYTVDAGTGAGKVDIGVNQSPSRRLLHAHVTGTGDVSIQQAPPS